MEHTYLEEITQLECVDVCVLETRIDTSYRIFLGYNEQTLCHFFVFYIETTLYTSLVSLNCKPILSKFRREGAPKSFKYVKPQIITEFRQLHFYTHT